MAIIVAATTMLTGRNKLAVENIPGGVEVADSGVEPVGRAIVCVSLHALLPVSLKMLKFWFLQQLGNSSVIFV
jgi:hypothetical protein